MPHKINTASLQVRPSESAIKMVERALRPWERLCNPTFIGIDNIPKDRPVLFVGNHTIFGMLDSPLLVMELYRQCGIHVRTLGDHFHFAIPGWRSFLTAFGTVDGNRENCSALMQAGEHVMVFPGGGREVVKRKGEKYTLIWKQRLGFAHMAIEHGYSILPFAAVGAEECYNILYDADDLLRSPLGSVVNKLGIPDKFIPPIAHGIGPSLFPKPQPMYFKFGEPISSAKLKTTDKDAWKLREETAQSINRMIVELLDYRHLDNSPNWSQRLLKR